MKVAPTMAGGLKIEAEVAGDWEVLRFISHDARLGKVDLAERLARRLRPGELANDWRAFVVPDLRSTFGEQLALVERVIEAAAVQSHGGPGEIFVPPGEVMSWFGALNQARLGLQERYQFSESERPDLASMHPGRRSGYLRGRFYAVVQEIMLNHLM